MRLQERGMLCSLRLVDDGCEEGALVIITRCSSSELREERLREETDGVFDVLYATRRK